MKCSANGYEMNTIIISAIAKTINTNKNSKEKPEENSDSGTKFKNFYFKNMDIGEELNSKWDHVHGEQLNTAKLCVEVNLAQK